MPQALGAAIAAAVPATAAIAIGTTTFATLVLGAGLPNISALLQPASKR